MPFSAEVSMVTSKVVARASALETLKRPTVAAMTTHLHSYAADALLATTSSLGASIWITEWRRQNRRVF